MKFIETRLLYTLLINEIHRNPSLVHIIDKVKRNEINSIRQPISFIGRHRCSKIYLFIRSFHGYFLSVCKNQKKMVALLQMMK